MEKFNKNNLIHSLDETETKQPIFKSIAIFFIVILLGVGTGYGASYFMKSKSAVKTTTSATVTTTDTKTEGIKDEKNFKDMAEGILKDGGIDGEGQYHLERPGGESQNVYLTSSALDLSKYIGKKVKVWGQTFTSQKAGWLMDVGLIKEN